MAGSSPDNGPRGGGPFGTGGSGAPPSEGQVAWGLPSAGEHRWPAPAVAVAIALQIRLPESVTRGLGPRLLLPALEAALLIVLLVVNPGRINREEQRLRVMGSC